MKTCLNLQEKCLISQRQVYDAIKAHEGTLNVKITPKLRSYATSSRVSYEKSLKEKREQASAEEKKKALKRNTQVQIKDLSKKKKQLLNEVQEECNRIDQVIKHLGKVQLVQHTENIVSKSVLIHVSVLSLFSHGVNFY